MMIGNRRWLRWAPAGCVLLLCSGCIVPQPRGEGDLSRVVEPTTKRGYWLYLPSGYVAADEMQRRTRRWPLVVSFHGMKPFDNARSQAREWQQEADRYGFIVVAPELGAPDLFQQFPLKNVTGALAKDEQTTLAILEHVFATTRADPSHVLATSWSSGGYMAHYMLNRHPERFTCLAARQSNCAVSVLDPALAPHSLYHPIFIFNTQNDFAICKKESREAVEWYQAHGYKNVGWILIKDKGHERTPDMAADFFGRVAGVQPNSPPTVLARRQAIDGNPDGIALLSGTLVEFESRPVRIARGDPRPATRSETPRRAVPARISPPHAARPTALRYPGGRLTRDRISAVPERPAVTRSPVSIRLSSAIGIEPLHLGFSAECPSNWQRTADFLWTLNGERITSGQNGQKTLSDAGVYTLALLVVTSEGREHRVKRTIRVLPRLQNTTAVDSVRE